MSAPDPDAILYESPIHDQGRLGGELAPAFGVADHRFFRETARCEPLGRCSPAGSATPRDDGRPVGLGEGCPNGGMLLSLGAHAFAVAGASAKFADGNRQIAPAAARPARSSAPCRDRSQGRLRRDGDGDALRRDRERLSCSTARRPGSPTRPGRRLRGLRHQGCAAPLAGHQRLPGRAPRRASPRRHRRCRAPARRSAR